MSNQYLKLRRSAVPGKIPTTSSIDFGEIALNTYDGLAFMKKSGSNGEEIITIGSTSGDFSGSFTGSLEGTASWAISSSQAYSSSYATTAWNITGNDNIDSGSHFIGTNTLQPIVFKVNNTQAGFITCRTGSAASTSGTVTLGQFAGQALGLNNGATTLIGHGAGANLVFNPTKGHQSTIIGLWAGYSSKYFSDPFGARNVFVGQSAAFRNHNGSSLTYVGTFAGELNNQGNVNTGIGRDALRSNIDGNYNTALGGLSLLYNTTGIKTISLLNSGSGYTYANVSISAPPATSPGVYQTTATATASISGGQITGITIVNPGGGYSLLTGDGDAFHTGITVTITGDGIDAQAEVTETQSATGNLALGYAAGITHKHGNYNIFMGYIAGGSFNSGSYNVIIGGNNGSSIDRTNNNILISDGQGNERFRIPSTGNLLLGTTVDSGYKLDVNGSGRFSNGLTITGSLLSLSITGSLLGTSSWAISASWAPNSLSASYALTASYYNGSVVSASYALTASYALNSSNVNTSSLVTTSSFNSFTASYNTGSFSGSLEGTSSWAISASWAPTNELTGGVTNYLTKWSSSSNLVTSSVFEDESGRFITIDQTAPIRAGRVTGSAGQLTNTMFGYNNQISSSGYQNDSFGFRALESNTIGRDILAIGAFSLNKNKDGVENIGLGRDANSQLVVGSYNTVVGVVGLYDLQSGSYNTIVGNRTGRGIISGSYNTIIGANIQGLSSNLTNTVIIADGTSGTDAYRIYSPDSKNILIGTTVDSGYKLDVSGSGRFTNGLNITGSLVASSFTGSLEGTASYAITASYALNGGGSSVDTGSFMVTASVVNTTITFTKGDGSTFDVTISQSGSVSTASYAIFAQTAATASYYGGSVTSASYSNNASNASTASYVLNAISASYSVNSTTASYVATSSWAVNTINATTAITASYILNAVSASYAISASKAINANTASYVATSSWANNALSASYVLNAVSASYVLNAATASYVLNAVSASKAVTASYVLNAVSASYYGGSVASASYAITSSYSSIFNISSSLYSTLGATGLAATTSSIVNIATSSYTAAWFDYTVSSGSNSRAGTVMSVWNGNNIQYTDNSTIDIGNTNDVTMSVVINAGNVILRSTTNVYQWNIKTTYRLI